ncbi:TetR/AcrR family transcriptional regulator [Limosilactobacillus agrestis]|uniref:TetR/AcrR family transcriptional regulator n=1 Tax=Limosilactobacillus agrestis TaxID=2759748 RepID=UPI001E55ABC1|nr:TetR/AcrR family transcriptional regulator [Limosilactobacillus agrestis]MCD7113243.1 TetR/AcrR family transcriptional regulator [Limosilactobacillus agrestis]
MKRGKLSREVAISEAVKIVQEKGINGLTYNGLARALEIQPQSLYRYLKNITDAKSEVIAAIINKWINDVNNKLKQYSGKEYLKQFAIYFLNSQSDILNTEVLTALSKYNQITCVQTAIKNLHALPANVIKSITKNQNNVELNIHLSDYLIEFSFPILR